ncbi:MAG TPA: hypothetical protein VNF73_10945 [Candidatus Saccharimonadales bacterium]|nr:hypothetical protein [Candidatus Saccharimonadales bacterium]
MSGPTIRMLVALLGGAAILVVAAWLDTAVLLGIEHRVAATFDTTEWALALPAARVATAGSILALALLAWWARSLRVGLAYVVVGAFFAFLGSLNVLFATAVNGAPPVLPEPIATFLGQVYLHAEYGPLNAPAVIGAGMLLIGLATIGLSLRSRASAVPRDEEGPMQAPTEPRP